MLSVITTGKDHALYSYILTPATIQDHALCPHMLPVAPIVQDHALCSYILTVATTVQVHALYCTSCQILLLLRIMLRTRTFCQCHYCSGSCSELYILSVTTTVKDHDLYSHVLTVTTIVKDHAPPCSHTEKQPATKQPRFPVSGIPQNNTKNIQIFR